MRKFVAVSFLLLCFTSLIYAQNTQLEQNTVKTDSANQTITAHISASHLQTECFNSVCSWKLYADAVLNGKKIELSGSAIITMNNYSLIKRETIRSGSRKTSTTQTEHCSVRHMIFSCLMAPFGIALPLELPNSAAYRRIATAGPPIPFGMNRLIASN